MLLERLNFLHVALANLTRKRVSFLDLTIMHGRGQEGKNDSLNRCRFHVWLETVRRTLLCCMLPLRVTWTSREKKNLYIYLFFFKFWTKYNTTWKEIVFKWTTQFILHTSLFVYFTTSSYFIYLLFNAVIRSITMFQPIFHFEIVNIYKHNFIKELSYLLYL